MKLQKKRRFRMIFKFVRNLADLICKTPRTPALPVTCTYHGQKTQKVRCSIVEITGGNHVQACMIRILESRGSCLMSQCCYSHRDIGGQAPAHVCAGKLCTISLLNTGSGITRFAGNMSFASIWCMTGPARIRDNRPLAKPCYTPVYLARKLA